MKKNHLPQSIQKILLVLTDTLIEEPEDLIIHERHEQLIQRSSVLLFEMSWWLRWGFYIGLWLFNMMAIFWHFEFKSFMAMDVARRQDFVGFWLHTRHSTLREFFKGIRTLIMICYFSHHDVWNYIGYHPGPHIQERRALREKLVKKAGQDGGTA